MNALIFDFDGLILDTEYSDYISWQELYAAHGRQLPFDLWLGNLGTLNRVDLCDHLATLVEGPFDAPAQRRHRHQRHLEKIATLDISPGVLPLLNEARQHGLKLAVASSSPHQWVDGHLARLGLLPYFDYTVCRDDVNNRAKPDPAVYLLALQKLGVTGRDAIAFEDSLNGIHAAKAAGIYCIAVPNPLTRHLDHSPADRQLTTLANLTLADLTPP